VLNVLLARARGELLDALAAAGAPLLARGGGGGAAAAAAPAASAWAQLLAWAPGLAALKRLVALSLLEWGCLVAKDVLLGLARASRTGASRALYFAALLRQDLAFFGAHHSAALAARLEVDPETLDELLVHGPERLVQGLVALGTLAWLLWVDPALLALSLLLRLPQVLQVTEASVRIAAAYERLAAARLQGATARAADALANARAVQAHGAQVGEVAGYCGALERYLDVVRASSLARALLKRSEGVVLLATEVALVAFGALRILQGGTSVGQFASRRDAVGTVIENFHGLEHVCAWRAGFFLRARPRRCFPFRCAGLPAAASRAGRAFTSPPHPTQPHSPTMQT
jgi:ABC-type multidrug transport system fused ATPase/permease subunit